MPYTKQAKIKTFNLKLASFVRLVDLFQIDLKIDLAYITARKVKRLITPDSTTGFGGMFARFIRHKIVKRLFIVDMRPDPSGAVGVVFNPTCKEVHEGIRDTVMKVV
jgi:hypothetical protein